MNCLKVITIAPYVTTYCMKPENHDGPCELPEEINGLYEVQSKRCTSVNPETQVMCGLPIGHIGSHQNGLLTTTWREKQKSS